MVREFGHYDIGWWESHPEWWQRFWTTIDAESDAFAQMNK